ncbi:MAG: uroporphyrinogen decarboxylase family protein [Anaerolineae bacterium]
MDPRDRYLAVLRFDRPDRVPLQPGGPRESTLAAWHAQGLPADADWTAALAAEVGVPAEAFVGPAHLPELFRMIPTFEEKVLEHRDGHYIVQDWMGAITEISDRYDYTYIRAAKDFVTRRWHRWPVESRADWEEKIKWRYDPADPRRFTPEFWARAEAAAASGRPVSLSVNGPFWQMREWVGMEGLCRLMIDDPQLVHDMAAFWTEYTLRVLETLLRRVRLDILAISEDMAYKAHSMISPAMTRRFLQPTYLAWRDLLRSHGETIMDMDSDGYIAHLIPIWIESGITVCDPIEVAAGNDILAFRRQFGRQMAYRGGIDKRALAAGGQTMRDEVLRVAPLIADGGYIPGCDHGVPPDISWPNFIEYTRLLAQWTGWL